MQNFASQQIRKHDFVIQIARTNQGMVQRVGVVLGTVETDQGSRLRVGWYDPTEEETSAMESVVGVDNLIKVDPITLPDTTVRPLGFVLYRGRAKL